MTGALGSGQVTRLLRSAARNRQERRISSTARVSFPLSIGCRISYFSCVEMTRDEILKTLSDHKENIKGFGVSRLGLFGSSARGENTKQSDLDFLVEFQKKSFDAYMDLKEYLENLFCRPVDLVLQDDLKPRIRSSIMNEVVHAAGL